MISKASNLDLKEISKSSKSIAEEMAKSMRTLKGIKNMIEDVGLNFKDPKNVELYLHDIKASFFWFEKAYQTATNIAYERDVFK